MSRKRLGRAALSAYPAGVRTERGEELLGTLLEVGEISRPMFMRELLSVLAGGLASRARGTLTQPLAPILLQALCWGAVMSVVRPLFTVLAVQLGPIGFQRASAATILVAYVGPGLFLTLFTAGRARLAGLVGLAWAAAHLLVHDTPLLLAWPLGGLAPVLLTITGCVVMLRRPQYMPRGDRRLWIVVAVAVGYVAQGQHGIEPLVLAAPVLVALLCLPISPAFALGTAIAWSYLGASLLIVYGHDAIPVPLQNLSYAPIAAILTLLIRRAAKPA